MTTKEKRLNVRIDEQLLRQLKAEAALRGITLSDLIRELAENYIEPRKHLLTGPRAIKSEH